MRSIILRIKLRKITKINQRMQYTINTEKEPMSHKDIQKYNDVNNNLKSYKNEYKVPRNAYIHNYRRYRNGIAIMKTVCSFENISGVSGDITDIFFDLKIKFFQKYIRGIRSQS